MQGAFNSTTTASLMPRQFLNESEMSVGGNRGDSLVPVLNFNRRQRNIDHIAVCATSGHLDPIAHHDHIVNRQLKTSNKTQYGVLKNQRRIAVTAPRPEKNTSGISLESPKG